MSVIKSTSFELMRHLELSNLLTKLLPIAHLAGNAIMAVYHQSGTAEIQHKDDDSPVTAADLAAHCVLVRNLEQLFPHYPVVSEEDKQSQACRCSEERFWLIDPLDGTKEFIARNGDFTVNIALIEDKRPVLGVVYAPAIDALYWGGRGIGAFRKLGTETTPVQIQVGCDKSHGACRVVASKSHLNTETQAFIHRLGLVNLIQAGSSLKFCRVAEGEADIYPRLAPTCEWDTAAAQAILEGAGGAVLDLQGQPLLYGKPEILNPSFIATRDIALIPASR